MSINTKTNDILNELNRLNEAKNNGVLSPSEFSFLIKDVEALHANSVRQGKVTSEEFSSDVEVYYAGLDKIFKGYTGLDVVSSLAREDREIFATMQVEKTGRVRSFGIR